MRVVFDSNVFVSALACPRRQAEKAILRIIAGEDQLLVSKPIIDEVLGVLARKFAREREELARAAIVLADLGAMIRTRRRLRVLRDEADNRIIECADAGHADLIVTRDRAMLELGGFENIRIVTLRAYLED